MISFSNSGFFFCPAPKAFQPKKVESKTTEAQDPFSKDRTLDHPKEWRLQSEEIYQNRHQADGDKTRQKHLEGARQVRVEETGSENDIHRMEATGEERPSQTRDTPSSTTASRC